jgi:hypothetical protein
MNFKDNIKTISDSNLVTERIRLEEWLTDLGLKHNPFEPIDAKDEVNLGECFVHPMGFNELLDKQSMILYAPFGGGKTASQRMTNHYCDVEATSSKIFSVRYNDLQRVIEEAGHDINSVTTRMHVEAILRNAVPKLFDYLIQRPELADNFESLTNLRLFINRFSHCLVDYRLDQTLKGTGVTKRQITEIITPKYDFDQLIVRMGISPAICRRLRITLLACDQFNSNRELRAIFVDKRISSWRDNLPGAGNPHSRVITTISYLYDKYNSKEENALVLFLRALRAYVSPDDHLHKRIKNLAIEIERELEGNQERDASGTSISATERDFRGIDSLLSEILEYEDYRPRVRFVANLLAQDVDEVSLNELSPTRLLKKFRDLTNKVGFEAIFILVDNIDGLPETDNDPQASATLLRPLIGTAALMNLPGIFFKLFLPLETKSLIEQCQYKAFRRGHINSIVVEWTHERLLRILRKRLAGATANKHKITSLDRLCEAGLRGKIDNKLVALADTPRELLVLAGDLLKIHIHRSYDNVYITGEDLDFILEHRRVD